MFRNTFALINTARGSTALVIHRGGRRGANLLPHQTSSMIVTSRLNNTRSLKTASNKKLLLFVGKHQTTTTTLNSEPPPDFTIIADSDEDLSWRSDEDDDDGAFASRKSFKDLHDNDNASFKSRNRYRDSSSSSSSISSRRRNNDKKNHHNKERGSFTTSTRRRSNRNAAADEFQQTRVFVQNIPPSVDWRQLKDHFKIAGEVIFASVSIDSSGKHRGHGIVQFETVDDAKNAIQIMRDYPMMIEGQKAPPLYVREDVQEQQSRTTTNSNNNNNNGSSYDTNGNQFRTRRMAGWKCADEATAGEMLDEEARLSIEAIVKARDDSRKRRNFDAADEMREDLKFNYGVHLDDRLKIWWVSTDNVVPDSVKEVKGEGNWKGPKPWRQIPTTPENDACVNPDLVFGLLKQRDVARMEKDFRTADYLLEQARTAPDGDLVLRIHDESRTWRIWTDEPPPRSASAAFVQKKQKEHVDTDPYHQCIALVSEHAPEKLDEVKQLLKSFPGREYNILKKLKQRYQT